MKIEKISDDKQKIITTSLIISDEFCEKIIPIFLSNKDILYKNFTSCNYTIITWCIDYYKNYQKAPHQHIKDIFDSKKDIMKSEEKSLIKKTLSYLSSRYEREEKFNENYVIDQAKLYLREVNLGLLTKNIEEAKKNGDIDRAENLVLTYSKFEQQTEKRQTTSLFHDIDKIKQVCDYQLDHNIDNRLFKLRGDIGKDLGWIYREDFFTFASFGKKGKSFYLRETAIEAAINYGLNVLIFNLEMSHNKYVRNFYQNVSKEVRDSKEFVRLPYFEETDNKKYNIEYMDVKKKGLSSKIVESRIKKLKIKTKGNIVIESFSSNTLTFRKCVKILDDYLLQGFVCDVLLIDFLDNLGTEFKGDFRHQIDSKWVNTRRLAQEKHIAIGTVTHTNIATSKGNVEPGKLSEDNRKYNHITHAIGINQLSHEKDQQYTRLNIIANRDEDFNPNKFYISLECRDIGKVLIDNKSMRDVILGDNEE